MLTSDAAAQICDELLLRCRSLPELTRALRAFGSRRGHRSMRATAAADQEATQQRWQELLIEEARIIDQQELGPRIHSRDPQSR